MRIGIQVWMRERDERSAVLALEGYAGDRECSAEALEGGKVFLEFDTFSEADPGGFRSSSWNVCRFRQRLAPHLVAGLKVRGIR